MATTLHGGPRDGETIDAPGAFAIIVPEYVKPKRQPTPEDRFYLDPFEYVDPDCNPTFAQHRYDTRTGRYLGVDD